MLLQDLVEKKLIEPPTWLPSNTHYLTVMGSQAYGVATEWSDLDMYGVAIPPKEYLFKPNVIHGFDIDTKVFNNWLQHDVQDKSSKKHYDFQIFNIAKYFQLLRKNNPNIIDSLFVPRECIKHITQAFEIIRENRRGFLHKGLFNTFKGYAYGQLTDLKKAKKSCALIWSFEESAGIPHSTTFAEAQTLGNSKYLEIYVDGVNKSKRFESQKIHGFDLKFAYHVYRLVSQAEYMLTHGDLDLQESGRVAKMKAIRNAEVPEKEIIRWFQEAEHRLERLKETSKLPDRPNENFIRALLMNCLESHYGNIERAHKDLDSIIVDEISSIFRKYGK